MLGVLLWLLLTLAATVGHSVVSARVAHGQMPGLTVELWLPQVDK